LASKVKRTALHNVGMNMLNCTHKCSKGYGNSVFQTNLVQNMYQMVEGLGKTTQYHTNQFKLTLATFAAIKQIARQVITSVVHKRLSSRVKQKNHTTLTKHVKCKYFINMYKQI
jgi:hypothetical protein